MFYRLLLIVTLICPASVRAAETPTVHFVIDTSKDRHSISPYIYGANGGRRPLNRLGGNRWTAYNWENNASNAGNDWHNQNDRFLSESDVPGAAVLPAIQAAARLKQALIVTIPTCGYVAADKQPEGDVNQTPDYLSKRFRVSLAKKPGAFSLSPELTDNYVYEDEFVNWIEKSGRVDSGQTIFYALDNEPDLWSQTHARIHPRPVTYAELVQKTIDYAGAIKDVKPDATVFGFISYGWNGYMTLQNAPDGQGRNFIEFFLSQMKEAEKHQGRRLLDVLDLHWYPEAMGGKVRITTKDTSAAVANARMQAPRSLWDPTYAETSWIVQAAHGPIALIPRIKKMIAANYPGTKLSFTEYDYGAGNSISGAIAEADALGIFGQQDVFAAAWWNEGLGSNYVNAAFDMYLNYDGHGSHFGDTYVSATSDDVAAASVYASIDKNDPSQLTLVLINRTDHAIDGEISIANSARFTRAEVFQLLSSKPAIRPGGQMALPESNSIKYTLPASSISMLRLAEGG